MESEIRYQLITKCALKAHENHILFCLRHPCPSTFFVYKQHGRFLISNEGKLLFLLYINDLGSASNGLSTFMFADDTSMLGHDKNINSLQSCINENLQMVSEWLQVNKLSLNISKSHFMLFTRKRTDVHDINIEINNITISRVKNVKFLGVILDEKMSWKDHINYISKKISKCIAIMFKL